MYPLEVKDASSLEGSLRERSMFGIHLCILYLGKLCSRNVFCHFHGNRNFQNFEILNNLVERIVEEKWFCSFCFFPFIQKHNPFKKKVWKIVWREVRPLCGNLITFCLNFTQSLRIIRMAIKITKRWSILNKLLF